MSVYTVLYGTRNLRMKANTIPTLVDFLAIVEKV